MADHPLSIRLDDDPERALSLRTRNGRSRSEPVRAALVEAAERERRVATTSSGTRYGVVVQADDLLACRR